MKQMTVMQFLRAGARQLLCDIAQDIFLGASLWPDALKIERRFHLEGYTMTKLTWFEWQDKADKALQILKQASNPFERGYFEDRPFLISCAQSDLRDFRNIYGETALRRIQG